MTDIAIAVGNTLGITDSGDALTAGGLILSSAVLIAVVLLMSYAGRGKSKNILGEIIVIFSVMGVLTLIAWLPSWVIIVGFIALAALFANNIRGGLNK